MGRASILMVMAGPNGSGKSTITAQYPPIGDYVNADEIERHLNCSTLKAAQIAENTREYLLSQHKDFTFETVLSTARNYDLMAKAKENGYTVVCVFVLTSNANINVYRVESRVKNGGHNVPEEKVRERYHRAMKLFPRLFDICDELYVYDNSLDRTQGEPTRIIEYRYGKIQLIPSSVWSLEMLENLCNGRYSGE